VPSLTLIEWIKTDQLSQSRLPNTHLLNNIPIPDATCSHGQYADVRARVGDDSALLLHVSEVTNRQTSYRGVTHATDDQPRLIVHPLCSLPSLRPKLCDDLLLGSEPLVTTHPACCATAGNGCMA